MAKSQVRKMDLRQLEKEINNNKTARASFVKNPAAYFEAQGLTLSKSNKRAINQQFKGKTAAELNKPEVTFTFSVKVKF